MTTRQALFLDQLPAGSRAVVRELKGGRGFAGRLAGMGISAGCQIEVLQNAARGPLLVRVRGTRLALGRGEAAKILVMPLEQGQADAGQ
jgi:ferrous iron transport protein A